MSKNNEVIKEFPEGMKPLGKSDWIILFILGTLLLNVVGLAIVAFFFTRSHY